MNVMLLITGENEVADLMKFARHQANDVCKFNDGMFSQGHAAGRLLLARFHLPWPSSDAREIACMSAENEIRFLFHRARERSRSAQ